eukprot:2812549-Prymnesium_polylepis.3
MSRHPPGKAGPLAGGHGRSGGGGGRGHWGTSKGRWGLVRTRCMRKPLVAAAHFRASGLSAVCAWSRLPSRRVYK